MARSTQNNYYATSCKIHWIRTCYYRTSRSWSWNRSCIQRSNHCYSTEPCSTTSTIRLRYPRVRSIRGYRTICSDDVILTTILIVIMTNINPFLQSADMLTPFSVAIHTFINVMDRNPIRIATKGSSGIYCWVNKLNGKCYIGKATLLYPRISNYYQDAHIDKNRFSSLICAAIYKYGIENFSLVILEMNPSDLAAAEQKWINSLTCEYNQQRNVLLPVKPNNTLGKRDRTGANNSFYGRQHTDEAKAALSKAASTRLQVPKPGHEFTITDTMLGVTTSYPSIRKGVEAMNWDQGYIMNRLKKGVTKPYLGRYLMMVTKLFKHDYPSEL